MALDTEVENNLLFIEQVEQWLDENRPDRGGSGGSRPYYNLNAVGALTTDELEACLAVHSG